MTLNIKAYEKAQHEAVVFKHYDYAKIEVAGADHEVFLNNILSQNMLGMKPGEWRETALLSATSHVLAYMYALKLDQSILLLAPAQSFEKVGALLDKFLITEDVQMRDAESDWDLFEIWGPKAEELAKKNTSSGFIYKPEKKIGRILLTVKIAEKNFQNKRFESDDLREVLRTENKILEFGTDFDEKIMLSETRLEKKAASETKGCYPGQEVVAKIETYKRLNRSFVGLVIDADLSLVEAGSIICDESGSEIGRLTSRAYSPSLKKTVGLGWLKRGFFDKPIKVAIKSEMTISALTLPF